MVDYAPDFGALMVGVSAGAIGTIFTGAFLYAFCGRAETAYEHTLERARASLGDSHVQVVLAAAAADSAGLSSVDADLLARVLNAVKAVGSDNVRSFLNSLGSHPTFFANVTDDMIGDFEVLFGQIGAETACDLIHEVRDGGNLSDPVSKNVVVDVMAAARKVGSETVECTIKQLAGSKKSRPCYDHSLRWIVAELGDKYVEFILNREVANIAAHAAQTVPALEREDLDGDLNEETGDAGADEEDSDPSGDENDSGDEVDAGPEGESDDEPASDSDPPEVVEFPAPATAVANASKMQSRLRASSAQAAGEDGDAAPAQ